MKHLDGEGLGRINLRLKEKDLEDAKALAKKHSIALSQLIRLLLQKAIQGKCDVV